MDRPAPPSPTADDLRARFDAPSQLTVGVEEELLLLDPGTLTPTPRASEVLQTAGAGNLKLELPAAQVEIVTQPATRVDAVTAQLREARRSLVEACADLARPVGVGAPPLGSGEGALNPGARYERIAAEYGVAARRQLVCGLQVHVAVPGAGAALAVYNALRSHLPDVAALAANAPYHAGEDTGLASIRPTICTALPRQGVPPALPSWEAFADALRWGRVAGRVPDARQWWWEVRPNPRFATLEVRVPDAQATVEDAGAVTAVVYTLVAALAARHGAGDALPVHPSWRIAENRWSAVRHGVEGEMANLDTGERQPTRERLLRLLDEVEPAAAGQGTEHELAHARNLVERNGAIRQRRAAAHAREAAAWLVERFGDGL